MNHVIYFGEHPRPGVFRIDVREGLWLYTDQGGRLHSVASTQPIGTAALTEVLGALVIAGPTQAVAA